jgi:uncharacterized membrane protein YheB (UPF0754 family)
MLVVGLYYKKDLSMNKSLITNLTAALLAICGMFSSVHGEVIFIVGIFALSGGVTNWLAIHMLFEKVPFLYGSGVVPNHFEDFKLGIKKLIVEEFFTHAHIDQFFQQKGANEAAGIVNKVDFNHVFEGIIETIEASKLGGMLAMVGGKAALEPLREPITLKIKDIIAELAADGSIDGAGNNFTSVLIEKVEHIIDVRLEELTPENVKHIVQNMIHKHLGWLVVWGGVFGGFIGFLVHLLELSS